MFTPSNNKLARDEALRRVQKSDILHSSGLVNNDTIAGTISSQTYQQRQTMIRQHIGNYNKSRLGAVRTPAARAQSVGSATSTKSALAKSSAQKPNGRFNSRITRHSQS